MPVNPLRQLDRDASTTNELDGASEAVRNRTLNLPQSELDAVIEAERRESGTMQAPDWSRPRLQVELVGRTGRLPSLIHSELTDMWIVPSEQ